MNSYFLMFKKVLLLVFVFLVVSGCKNSKANDYVNNVIATAHPLASEAGELMFEMGGTATDAAVAAAFTLAVVEPSMSGIGGRLQILYRNSDGTIEGIDASTEVPQNYIASETRYSYGYETIGIPGVVAGLLTLHQKSGTLPLQAVMAPAIKHAEEGFKLLSGEVLRQEMATKNILEFEGTKSYFLKADLSTYNAGEYLIQKDLANTLKRISTNGHKGFYEGETAQRIVEDVQANGGILTLEDLKNYKALPAKVLKGSYRNHDIHALYLPSFGAVTIQILQLLDQLNPIKKDDPSWAKIVGKVTKMAYDYRQYQTNQDSLNSMLAPNSARRMMADLDMNKGDISAVLKTPISWNAAVGHTSHLTAADSKGRIVSLTQTIGPNMGSKVATKGLGFLYAVTLGGVSRRL